MECRPPPAPLSDVMQPGSRHLHYVPIDVDGMLSHDASCVHCTLGGTASPNQRCSWWLLGARERWETIYAYNNVPCPLDTASSDGGHNRALVFPP